MKPEELSKLSIGDWVIVLNYHWDGRPCTGQVDGITKKHGTYYLQFGSALSAEIDRCEPIPITPEILEKNGWEQYGKDAYCFSILIQMAGDGFEQQNITIHRMKVLELRTSTCTLLMPIKFVHELQMAFKLCKVNKEIFL